MMLIVISLTLIAGVLGGFGSLFIGPLPWSQDQPGDEKLAAPLWWQLLSCLTLGVIAAALVPLFLSMAKSELVSTASNSGPTHAIDCFVYFGFCLIAAVTSRKFIDSLAARALRIADDAQHKIANLDRNLDEVTQTLEEPEPPADNLRGPSGANLEAPLDPKFMVLHALVTHPKFTRRNVQGICAQTNMLYDEVQGHLERLSSEGLVERITGTDGRSLWTATRKGRATLKNG